MNINYSWFTKSKPLGISGIARLKNGGEFLESVVESHLPYLDEIILVDNMSTDNTKEICTKLTKKYPSKIKFYEYNYKVHGVGSGSNIKGNSIHSLAYYYNWCFSQSSYKYVMKIDDDNLLLPEKWIKIRTLILEQQPNKMNIFRGINVIKGDNCLLGVVSNDKYSGKYGDIGIYPTSKKTYYIQGPQFELFKNNLYFTDLGLSYIHLKFLKKDFGLHNYKNTIFYNKILNKINTSDILPIKDFIKNTQIPDF